MTVSLFAPALIMFLAVFGSAGMREPAAGPETVATEPIGPPVWAPPATELLTEAVVIEVIDGDSLVLFVEGQIRRYEILGADTPEWIERAPRQRAYSVEAKRFLTNMLGSEQVGVFEPEPGATDPLGRRRAYVFRLPDMAFVDLEIVRQGYGKVSTRAGEPYADLLRWYETRARELQRGVWGQPGADAESEAAPAAPPPARVVEAPAAPPTAPAPSKQPEPQPESDDGWVWVTRSGSKYHREGCSHLTSSRNRVRLDSIKSTHEPCKTCNPD